MPTVISAAHAHELLALVPHLTGFRPRESAVLIAFSAGRSRGAMRFDLPRGAPPPDRDRIATSMIGLISRLDGVDTVIPVVYTDDEFGPEAPYGGFVRAVIARADFTGFRVAEALCVAADGWGSYLDAEVPAGGRPLGLISAAAAQHGLVEPGEARELAVLPSVSPERVLRVQSEVFALLRLLESDCGDALERLLPAPRELLAVVERHLAAESVPGHLDLAEIAGIVVMLQSPAVRDAVMLLGAFGVDTGLRVLHLGERFPRAGTVPDDDDVAAMLLGEGRRPDPRRVGRAIALLTSLAAHAPRETRMPLLSMLAWLNWALGRSSVAAAFLDAARDIDPRYGLLGVLDAMIDGGRLPEWAFDASGG